MSMVMEYRGEVVGKVFAEMSGKYLNLITTDSEGKKAQVFVEYKALRQIVAQIELHMRQEAERENAIAAVFGK